MNIQNITVSKLPNITFYTGEDAQDCGHALENRDYTFYSDYYGNLSMNNNYNSYWSYINNSTFQENSTNYSNVGDILETTISYINKFKEDNEINNLDVSIYKNILTFNYDYTEDLLNEYDNTYIKPASNILDLLVNINDMCFNKKAYYKNKYELLDVTYYRKNYPYRPSNTILSIIDEDDEIITYDFSKQFVNYNYIVNRDYNTYTRPYMIPIELEDGTIAYEPDPVNTYIEVSYYYTYELYDINKLADRINLFFEQNSDRVKTEYGDLKTYYISELDTMLPLTLNTYSLSNKNMYAYFNFTSIYDNWFNNAITFEMNSEELLNNMNLLSIEPYEENWFNIIINDYDKPCGNDVKISQSHTFNITDNTLIQDEVTKFKIINPSKLKSIDLSENIDKIKKIDFINSYRKRKDIYNYINTNWIIENGQHIESLIIGNNSKEGIVEYLNGINNLVNIKNIDITNCNHLKKDFSIRKLSNLESFKADGSNIKSFIPKKGVDLSEVYLPSTIKTLTLQNVNIDLFDYEPNENLINVTLENVTGNGLNTKEFIENWINVLSTTKIDEGTPNETTMLLDGLITNTNLTGINWTNFNVETLLKFKYLGLNNFSGNIQIKGTNDNNSLTRQEYLNLINVFGEEIMECWNYKTSGNSKPIKFQYSLNQDLFKKNIHLYYYNKQEESWIADTYGIDSSLIHKITINDNLSGNALLDILDQFENENSMIELKLNKEEFGYEYKLNKKISVSGSSLTKDLSKGDIVLYKGEKLIIVTNPGQNNTVTMPYNYFKLGTIEITDPTRYKRPSIIISFNLVSADELSNILINLPKP